METNVINAICHSAHVIDDLIFELMDRYQIRSSDIAPLLTKVVDIKVNCK